MAGHAHGSGDHAGHSHAPKDFGRAFLIGTTLNMGFVIVEAVFGILANSMALLADAGHNLSDVAGLLIAWGAASLAKRGPTRHYTYGFRRSSILAALFNALFLLVAMGAIAFEAIQRFSDPQPISSGTVMLVAGVGIVINTATALLFASGRKGDINIRGAYLHMAADAAVSAGVVVAGFAIAKTGWLWLDPLTSLAIVAVIFFGTWGLLKDSVGLSLDRVPEGIAPAEVEQKLALLPGVSRVHDLHIWGMSTTEVALTCHLVMPEGLPDDEFLHEAAATLKEEFGIDHTTIQIERRDDGSCDQAPASVV
ncbi:MAG TPA: cation diffusion facilitator family transporter [Allosphingosinicella sp.]|nr:cation diffusion facilitator family transporter [Allosphingosinicella sp.]